jgi:hypothetical protein
MSEHVHIGDQIEFEENTENYFALSFLPLDVFDDWERCGKVADFIADYFQHNFRLESSQNLISTVFNEVLENAVKFSPNNSRPIEVVVKKRQETLLLRITNALSHHRFGPFTEISRELFNADLDDLYLSRIEDGAADESASGIGLILIKKDYGSRLSFDFSRGDIYKVSVTLEINIDEGM